jgi:serine/threonine-protein phosphatase 5
MQVLKYVPRDKDALRKYKECSKIVQQMLFAEAIASDRDAAAAIASVRVDLDHMAVEADYDGPHMPPQGVTLEFVAELTEHFRNQKRLHKKYVYQVWHGMAWHGMGWHGR